MFFLIMVREAVLRKKHTEPNENRVASRLRDFILGWQDGIVNVLGVILGVATATADIKIVLIAAFAAAFAESISMAAVAYTSFKAEREYYLSEVAREKDEMKSFPAAEKIEVRTIYRKLGFKGKLLEDIVKHIVSNKKRWLEVMMGQELKLSEQKTSLLNITAVIGFSALIGSFIPVIPFFLLPIQTAILAAIIFSASILFCVGFYKAKTTVGNPIRSGVEMALIGIVAALAGYAIGTIFGVVI